VSLGICSLIIPVPLSFTKIFKVLLSILAPISMRPLSSVYFAAFDARLEIAL
jgi:hypothetical protein